MRCAVALMIAAIATVGSPVDEAVRILEGRLRCVRRIHELGEQRAKAERRLSRSVERIGVLLEYQRNRLRDDADGSSVDSSDSDVDESRGLALRHGYRVLKEAFQSLVDHQLRNPSTSFDASYHVFAGLADLAELYLDASELSWALDSMKNLEKESCLGHRASLEEAKRNEAEATQQFRENYDSRKMCAALANALLELRKDFNAARSGHGGDARTILRQIVQMDDELVRFSQMSAGSI
jgi:hypothetical protein